ncbi:MAG: class I tRNA ligase family protein, partial [Caldilineales bacterium]|nr:class I tRNA ligase family protein [Caldilineales bacterium]
DERDFAFARKYGLEIRRVITGPDGATGTLEEAYDSKDEGEMINSGPFDGTPVNGAVGKVTEWLEANELGRGAVNYRLRDWLISRQRMWGAPIPIIYCPTCGVVPVPYADLPVLLPDDAEFRPSGESPLKYHAGFRNVKCPECGGDAERETDTMDTFLCSSWYQYAYLTPYWKTGQPLSPDDTPWNPAEGKIWLPVDQYTGGIEHATMHLLYTRFFTKAMRDAGLVDFDEPMLRLFNQGMILGEDGEKMSKSRGNVVNPDDYVGKYGADTVRAFLMFIGPWEMGGPWNPRAIEGVQRFLQRVWSLVVDAPAQRSPDTSASSVRALRRAAHQTIQKVTADIEQFKFNTVIAALMGFSNTLVEAKTTPAFGTAAWDEAISTLLLLMAPAMPHISEELWQRIGRPYSIHQQPWPVANPDLAKEDVVEMAVQVNGKVRDRIEVAADLAEADIQATALASAAVQKWLDGKTVRKVIVVPGRTVNIVA